MKVINQTPKTLLCPPDKKRRTNKNIEINNPKNDFLYIEYAKKIDMPTFVAIPYASCPNGLIEMYLWFKRKSCLNSLKLIKFDIDKLLICGGNKIRAIKQIKREITTMNWILKLPVFKKNLVSIFGNKIIKKNTNRDKRIVNLKNKDVFSNGSAKVMKVTGKKYIIVIIKAKISPIS